jgi:CRP-like cAMP-binding protein
MVDILFDLGTRHDIPSVKDLAVSCREHEMYQDGTVYGRPQVMHAIVSPPSARSRFIELYKRNTLICREGNIGKQLYILLNGRISVSIEGTYVASIHAPGEAFGELSLFLEGRRTATLVAEEDTNVYVVEHKNIRQFVRHNSPRLFFSTAESLTQRIMHNVRRIRRMEQMARGGKGEEVIQLQSAPVEELGKAEIASLVSQLRILHEADPHPVLRGYLKQYETEAS